MTRALRDVSPTSFHHPDMGRFGGGFTPGMEEALEAERREDEEEGRSDEGRAHRVAARRKHMGQRG